MGWTIGQRWLGHPQSKIAKPKGCNSSVCRQTRLHSLMDKYDGDERGFHTYAMANGRNGKRSIPRIGLRTMITTQ